MSEGSPSPAHPVDPAGDITVVCSLCGKPILPGAGWLLVSHSDINRTATAWSEFEERKRAESGIDGLVALDELMDLPGRAAWQAFHRTCDPDLDSHDYYIDVERFTTWADVVSWTAHLMGKTWLQHTNWAALLRGLAHGEPGLIRISHVGAGVEGAHG